MVEIGDLVMNRYQIRERIGFGGVGIVVRAYDFDTGGDVALKFIYPRLIQDVTMLARFANEVALTKHFRHPNIVQVYDLVQKADDCYFISMEFVRGYSLGSRIFERYYERPLIDVLLILEKICRGVAYAHTNGVIHRDLKPDNVLVSVNDEVKITDFGFARSRDRTVRLTQSGERIGTPGYMSPEQLLGEELDPRSDIYSLGILAFELAVGHHPFQGDANNWLTLTKAHLEEPIPVFAHEANGIPLWFEDFVKRCSAKKRDDRYDSVEDLLTVLRSQIRQLSPADACPIPQLFAPLE